MTFNCTIIRKKRVAAPKDNTKKVSIWLMVLNGLGSISNLLEIVSPIRAQENPIIFPMRGPKMAEFATSSHENTLAKKRLIRKKVIKPAMVETRNTVM
jgi:hypothetical protein